MRCRCREVDDGEWCDGEEITWLWVWSDKADGVSAPNCDEWWTIRKEVTVRDTKVEGEVETRMT